MNIEQSRWAETTGWCPQAPHKLGARAQLVLVFGGTSAIRKEPLLALITAAYPSAAILGCSTAGEICNTEVTDDTLVVTAIQFEKSHVAGYKLHLSADVNSYQAGQKLAQLLPKEDLVHVFVLSDGLNVNGSELVAGLSENLARNVTVTGGLSGDGARFASTYVLWNGPPEENAVVALGLYGTHLNVGYASLGGWDSFGPERLITRSKGNVLFELDGHSALELYKKYLGEHAKTLPSSGLLFPLSLRSSVSPMPVVRTILAVNEDEQSMTFAGDIPEGAYARLMKANFDRLIDGATGAARISAEPFKHAAPDLAILISCVGRKLVLKQRIEEEVEGVREVFGKQTILTGFYSYGEISPFNPSAKCELHNQTMTITTLSER
jgi:hypothetical protein